MRSSHNGHQIPSVLEVHKLSSSLALVTENIQAKALNCSRSYSTGALIKYTVQRISMAWMALKENANLAQLENLDLFYILFES